MGYYPKHLKRRRHLWNMRMIATAALSGCTFIKQRGWFVGDRIDLSVGSYEEWIIQFPDGQPSHSRAFATKSEAAAHYLVWWFAKTDMWPQHKAAHE